MTTYRFQVFSENGVSHLTSKPAEYADVVVTTEVAVASSITNVRVTSIKSSEISLAWDDPDDGEAVETYEVRCFQRGEMDGNATTILTTERQATLTGLQQRTEYGLQVRAKTARGWSAYSPVVFKTTGQVMNTGEGCSQSVKRLSTL